MQSIHCINCPKHAVYTLHHLVFATKTTACFVKKSMCKALCMKGGVLHKYAKQGLWVNKYPKQRL